MLQLIEESTLLCMKCSMLMLIILGASRLCAQSLVLEKKRLEIARMKHTLTGSPTSDKQGKNELKNKSVGAKGDRDRKH